MRINELYLSKEKRDARFKELKARGLNVRKGVSNNQQLHPQYVKDYVGSAQNDTGLGNTVYKTYFKKLYVVKEQL